jgi:hypothetical protein
MRTNFFPKQTTIKHKTKNYLSNTPQHQTTRAPCPYHLAAH